MDETDIEIIKLLIINSRLSYREIADYLGLSINAIYRRIQILIDLGIIQKFITKLNPNAVNAIYGLYALIFLLIERHYLNRKKVEKKIIDRVGGTL